MSEENFNFHHLLSLWAQENPEIIEWLRKRDEKYTSPEIQNELLEAMALGMIRKNTRLIMAWNHKAHAQSVNTHHRKTHLNVPHGGNN